MELTPDPGKPAWSDPVRAFDRPDIDASPYLHYYSRLHERRNPQPTSRPEGTPPPDLEAMIAAMIREAFEW